MIKGSRDRAPEGTLESMNPASARPRSLTAICILAIILGSMGAAGGLFGVLGLLLQEPLARMQEGLGPPDAQLQEFNRGMMEVNRTYAPLQWIGMPLNAVVSICLLIGGILSLRPNRSARQFLMAALIASIPLDLGLMAIGVLVQLSAVKLMEESLPNSGPPMGSFMRVAGMAWMAFGLLMVLAKLVYYGWGVAALRSEKVRNWNS